MRLPLGTVLVALLVVTVGGRPAYAQGFVHGSQELVSHHNTNGSSSLLEGGATATGRARSLQATNRQMSLFGHDDFEYMRGARAGGGGPMLGIAQVGLYNTLSAPAGGPLSAFQNRTGELTSLSGLGAAQNLQLPIPGVGAGFRRPGFQPSVVVRLPSRSSARRARETALARPLSRRRRRSPR